MRNTSHQNRTRMNTYLFCIFLAQSCCCFAFQPFRVVSPKAFTSSIEKEGTYYRSGHYELSQNSVALHLSSISRMRERTRVRIGDGVCRSMLSPTFASVFAGSLAGAIGVGVAFPLDTLKTKSQVLGSGNNKIGMGPLIRLIYQEEGVAGFFGGVKGMMIGQAFIKALAFSANTFVLQTLQSNEYITAHFPNVAGLLIAATFSGFVTSFLVAPIERIKVMMQATKDGVYENEIDCIKVILAKEGLVGLMGRGLMPTIAREVPSYGIYFVVYGVLTQMPLFLWLGKLAPLVAGAASGCACWIPVYPIDVVKTLIQNTEGDNASESAWAVAKQLYIDGGVGAFFDGLTPKMFRAAVNHAVTFQLYEMAMSAMPISVYS